jgi:hypothetical protein
MTRLILLFFVLTFFASCDFLGTPAGIIPKDKMISVLTDIQVVDAYVSALPNDSIKNQKIDFYQSVFNKYDTDSVQFKKSMEFYAKDPAKMQQMYEIIHTALDTLQSKVALEDKAVDVKK